MCGNPEKATHAEPPGSRPPQGSWSRGPSSSPGFSTSPQAWPCVPLHLSASFPEPRDLPGSWGHCHLEQSPSQLETLPGARPLTRSPFPTQLWGGDLYVASVGFLGEGATRPRGEHRSQHGQLLCPAVHIMEGMAHPLGGAVRNLTSCGTSSSANAPRLSAPRLPLLPTPPHLSLSSSPDLRPPLLLSSCPCLPSRPRLPSSPGWWSHSAHPASGVDGPMHLATSLFWSRFMPASSQSAVHFLGAGGLQLRAGLHFYFRSKEFSNLAFPKSFVL